MLARSNSHQGRFQIVRLWKAWPGQACCAATGLAAAILGMSGVAACQTRYVVTNNDPGVSVYAVGASGALTLKQQIRLAKPGVGNVGGYFGANRIQTLNSGNQQCIYASVAFIGQIVGIPISTLVANSGASGSATDNGASNGIGLAVNSRYLYASFVDSNTIGTFVLEPGCDLEFVNDVAVSGLAGGSINGMAIHGNMMIATFTDGSIESFDISSGTPTPNDDEKYSTAAVQSMGATYANSIDITSDGRYVIFGDTSSSMVVEVSNLSSGKLSPTTVYTSAASVSSSNVILSPDETILYVVNTQGASVSAFLFDKKTGRLALGCASAPIKGQSSQWSYLGAAALISQAGNGGGVYVAEFGDPAGMAMVTLQSSPFGTCILRETAQSPFAVASQGLLSIGTFPPRAF
jgi:hypothetical protein